MIEHWVERYHQIGFKYDDKWRLMKDEKLKTETRAHREHIAGNFQVMDRLNILEAAYTRGQRKRTTEKQEVERQVKKLRRDAAIGEARALHAKPDDFTLEAADLLCNFKNSSEAKL